MSYAARRLLRRAYLTRHQAQRRALLKAEGGKRVEITLRGPALDNYVIICRYLGKSGHQRVLMKALDIAARRILEDDRPE